MWLPCSRVLDTPVKVLGLEPEDLVASMALPFFAAFMVNALVSLTVGPVLGLALYYGKRGKPAGMLLHVLHDAEFFVKLPGFVPAKSLTYSPW